MQLNTKVDSRLSKSNNQLKIAVSVVCEFLTHFNKKKH